jgi:DNA mismatch repair protein MutL
MSPVSGRKIHLLDPATVNQIAAGEVVERPASVVKELVENSIDAGATRIIVEIKSGKEGITSIHVADNGCGMGAEDALSAFTPHATSKIHTIDDLNRCSTLGFRGEALASIAAVSEVTLVSCEEGGSPAAVEIVIRSGELIRSGETGAPPGTMVTVRELFFNTPARKKFQKSVTSEITLLTRILEAFATAHPGIAFRFIHNGNEKMASEGSGDLYDTIVSLYGSDVSSALVPVEAREGPVKITGYVSRPSVSRQNPYQVFVSVNRRQVSLRTVVEAIRAAYGTLLPDNRYPVAFIDLGIDPAFIDVNVHPSKRFVHLSGERDICALVSHAVGRALRGADLIPVVPEDPAAVSRPVGRGRGGAGTYSPHCFPAAVVGETTHSAYLTTDRRLRQTEMPMGTRVQGQVPEYEYLGQYDGSYILAKAPAGELLLIDQHAAHERVLYEQVTGCRESGKGSQELITPVVIRLSPAESTLLRDNIPLLSEKGFVIEEFGRDSFAVRVVPVVLGKISDTEVVRDIIADLISAPRGRGTDPAEHLTRSIACHGAVKAGTVLTPDLCRRLLSQLSQTRSPWTCPHGRPVMISFPRERLDQMFGRI